MAQALGVSLRDAQGQEIGFGGGTLSAAVALDATGLDPRLRETEIVAACDVRNPLVGENGAAAVYGPQKGATAEQVELLDRGLRHLAQLTERTLGAAYGVRPGAGAGGGLGFGLMAFCGARMRPGIDLVLDTAGFDRMLDSSDLVLTGEGNLDAQSAYGKAVAGVAARAGRRGIPVLAVAGGLGEDLEPLYNLGLSAAVSIVPRPCRWNRRSAGRAAARRRRGTGHAADQNGTEHASLPGELTCRRPALTSSARPHTLSL